MSFPRFVEEGDQRVPTAARGREINEFPPLRKGGRWAMFGCGAWLSEGCFCRFD